MAKKRTKPRLKSKTKRRAEWARAVEREPPWARLLVGGLVAVLGTGEERKRGEQMLGEELLRIAHDAFASSAREHDEVRRELVVTHADGRTEVIEPRVNSGGGNA